jgi:hypothetical membrane protein
MSQSQYFAVLALLALGIAVVITVVYGKGRTSALWPVVGACAVGLTIVGIWDEKRQSSPETPIASYMLVAILMPVVASLVVRSLANKGVRLVPKILGAAVAGWAVSIIGVLVGLALGTR